MIAEATENESANPFERLPDGAMWVNPRFRARLKEAGLDSFETVMTAARGRCLREQAVRENWYLPGDQATAAAPGLYLKKHHVRTLGSRLRALLGLGPGETPARQETRNVTVLNADGIAAMHVVAYGERLRPDGQQESFLLTEELRGYEDLDRRLRKRRSYQRARQRNACDRDRRALILAVADVARRFHSAGYNHRDFYCCHFFAKKTGRNKFEIRLIDLQRIQHRRWFRRRWLVKDLAQLAWSVPHGALSPSERMLFIKRYLGVTRLRPADRRLIREVLGKQQIMARRLGIKV
ncbi:MAG: lipopolysaccharide kinase InaA family protein [Planctomycetota bacterium]